MSVLKRFIKGNDTLFKGIKQILLYARYIESILQGNRYSKLKKYEYNSLIEISQKGFHCYFGYYDKSPMSKNGENILFLRVKDKATPGQLADVCIYNISTKNTSIVGYTSTWNWQQASMMQWVDDDTVAYNAYERTTNQYVNCRANIKNRSVLKNHRAAYSFNGSFTKFLSLNFYRLDLYAKGYGYPYQVDSLNVDEDGIWEVSCKDDLSEKILSLTDIINFDPKDYKDCQHYINHVAYCPDERYIIFIHRWQVKGGEFISRLLKYDLIERKLISLLDNGHVSHYCWKSKNELFIYATDSKGRKGYLTVDIDSGATDMFEGLPLEDGHPSYKKDGSMILTDIYPGKDRKQCLFLYDNINKELLKLDTLQSPFRYFNEERCDLHPRFSMDEKYVICDNTHSGLRSLRIYRI